jgi:hypothetical protein
MPATHVPARQLAGAAANTLGISGPAQHLSGRKGADVWRAGPWIIKTAVPGARGHLAHESAVYELLHAQGRHPGARTGTTAGGGRWLAVPALPGPSLWELFTPARDGSATSAQRGHLRVAARGLFTALRDLHAAGWRHGDVQPENVIDLGGRVELIDYDLAHHPGLPLPFPYRAGLVHVIAPETAAALARTGEDEPVELTAAAETYAAGAGLYWAWTGHWPTGYRGPADGDHRDLYADIAAGRRRDLTADRPYPDPELEHLITTATAPDPAARF